MGAGWAVPRGPQVDVSRGALELQLWTRTAATFLTPAKQISPGNTLPSGATGVTLLLASPAGSCVCWRLPSCQACHFSGLS